MTNGEKRHDSKFPGKILSEARLRKFRPTVPFKVTDFGTNRKTINNFLLVILLTCMPSRTISKLLQIIGEICDFDRKSYL